MVKQKMPQQINALSIDLEDWYHPELIREHVSLPKKSLVRDSTEALLNLLNRYNTKATFFVLGEVAIQNPGLIKRICANGHEIASHGFSHRTLYDIGHRGLRAELSEFKRVIAEILGDVEVKGFRAPSFSLNQDTSWAVDILKEHKFKYDSSIFPMKINNLYGVKGAPLNIYGLNNVDIKVPDAKSTLKEFPISVFEIGGFRFPISSGFYLRLIPVYFQKMFLKLINKERPFIIYIHPWECYTGIPRVELDILSGFISYYNIKSAFIKLEALLKNFNFDRIDNILGV